MTYRPTNGLSKTIRLLALTLLAFPGASCCSKKTEKIPLESMYGYIGGQEGVKGVVVDEFVAEEKLAAFAKLRPGASNLFLVHGDLTDAIKATVSLWSAEPLLLRKDRRRGQTWLCVFFGESSSDPTRWTIDSVERGSGKIRVNYRLPPPNHVGASADVRPYLAWVPLGDLKPGKYTLELANSRTAEVTLMRLVEVKTQK